MKLPEKSIWVPRRDFTYARTHHEDMISDPGLTFPKTRHPLLCTLIVHIPLKCNQFKFYLAIKPTRPALLLGRVRHPGWGRFWMWLKRGNCYLFTSLLLFLLSVIGNRPCGALCLLCQNNVAGLIYYTTWLGWIGWVPLVIPLQAVKCPGAWKLHSLTQKQVSK